MPRDTIPTQESEVAEQDDADSQAQTIADDALGRETDVYEDSEKGGPRDLGAIGPNDAPDLIDRMEQMVSSGHIDMGAYRGEPAHDDEADTFGADPDEIAEADAVPYDR